MSDVNRTLTSLLLSHTICRHFWRIVVIEVSYILERIFVFLEAQLVAHLVVELLFLNVFADLGFVSTYCIDHDSMVQLTEDRNGRFHVAYVLDRNTSPEMRREAALLAQKELADCMQEWDISLLNALVPERIKYASLAEAASHLVQVLNDPERIIG